MSRFAHCLAWLLVVLTLAACGKKGPPHAPADEPNTYPLLYPSQ